MITAGFAAAVLVALLGGAVALLGAGLSLLPQRRLEGTAAAARVAGERVALARLAIFAVTAVVWVLLIALGVLLDW